MRGKAYAKSICVTGLILALLLSSVPAMGFANESPNGELQTEDRVSIDAESDTGMPDESSMEPEEPTVTEEEADITAPEEPNAAEEGADTADSEEPDVTEEGADPEEADVTEGGADIADPEDPTETEAEDAEPEDTEETPITFLPVSGSSSRINESLGGNAIISGDETKLVIMEVGGDSAGNIGYYAAYTVSPNTAAGRSSVMRRALSELYDYADANSGKSYIIYIGADMTTLAANIFSNDATLHTVADATFASLSGLVDTLVLTECRLTILQLIRRPLRRQRQGSSQQRPETSISDVI